MSVYSNTPSSLGSPNFRSIRERSIRTSVGGRTTTEYQICETDEDGNEVCEEWDDASLSSDSESSSSLSDTQYDTESSSYSSSDTDEDQYEDDLDAFLDSVDSAREQIANVLSTEYRAPLVDPSLIATSGVASVNGTSAPKRSIVQDIIQSLQQSSGPDEQAQASNALSLLANGENHLRTHPTASAVFSVDNPSIPLSPEVADALLEETFVDTLTSPELKDFVVNLFRLYAREIAMAIGYEFKRNINNSVARAINSASRTATARSRTRTLGGTSMSDAAFSNFLQSLSPALLLSVAQSIPITGTKTLTTRQSPYLITEAQLRSGEPIAPPASKSLGASLLKQYAGTLPASRSGQTPLSALRFSRSSRSSRSPPSSSAGGRSRLFGSRRSRRANSAITGVVEADGSVVGSDGQLLASPGSVAAPEGSILATNGSVILRDGSVVPPQGSILAPNGDIIAPNGSIVGSASAGASIIPSPSPSQQAAIQSSPYTASLSQGSPYPATASPFVQTASSQLYPSAAFSGSPLTSSANPFSSQSFGSPSGSAIASSSLPQPFASSFQPQSVFFNDVANATNSLGNFSNSGGLTTNGFTANGLTNGFGNFSNGVANSLSNSLSNGFGGVTNNISGAFSSLASLQ